MQCQATMSPAAPGTTASDTLSPIPQDKGGKDPITESQTKEEHQGGLSGGVGTETTQTSTQVKMHTPGNFSEVLEDGTEAIKTISSDSLSPEDATDKTSTSIYLLYDERMTRHFPLNWKACETWPACKDVIPKEGYTFENPERIRRIHQRLLSLEIRLGGSRFSSLSCRPAKRDTVLLAHSANHYEELERTCTLTEEALEIKSKVDEDVYYNADTFLAATLSCGGVVSCVDAVTDHEALKTRAIAIVRPPGHHACQEEAMGKMCWFLVLKKYTCLSGPFLFYV